MPQLAFETFASQLFWLAVTFIVLYILMSKVVIPRVGGILEDREQRIRADLDKAESLKSETDAAIAEYQRKLAEARANAGDMIAAMKAEVTAEIDARKAEIDTELEGRQAEAEKQIAAQRDQAMSALDDVARSVTSALVEKLGGSASDDQVAQAITAAGQGGR